MKDQQTFNSLMKEFEYHFDLRTVFEDFLTMTICAFGRNPSTGLSYDEDLYLATVAKYKDSKLQNRFPQMLAALTNEMEVRFRSSEGYDILGSFYEEHIYRGGAGQFFTPWHVCEFMAQTTAFESASDEPSRPLRIVDPACGSGRMLLAANRVNGPMHEYYGIDLDPVCTKMTALNMFLSGMFRSEALCADALVPGDFKGSYQNRMLPMGIFRITEKEHSKGWHIMQNSWDKLRTQRKEYDGEASKFPDGSQLTIF